MKTKNLQLTIIAIATINIQLLTHSSIAQVSFSPATNFSVNSPYSVTCNDFNGDGKVDLAISNINSGNMSILLGDGAGGFGVVSTYTLNNNFYSLITADFNGDGNLDMATAGNSISLLLGSGTGSFSAPTNITTGGTSYSIITADFNEDGKLDLATANSSQVLVLLGDGAGNFSTPVNFAWGSGITSLISDDFNGDGNTDLAIGDQVSNNVSVSLGDGLGGFGTQNDFAVGSGPSSITSSDFNGDGKADLATANQGSNNVSVLLGNGIGGFGVATNFMAGSIPVFVITNDFNLDGKNDLAITNNGSGNVSVLLGDGAGGFGLATNFVTGTDPCGGVAKDFNGDGKIDLAVPNASSDNVSVLLNNTSPPFPPICLVTVDSTLTHNVVIWEKTSLNMTDIDSFLVFREVSTNNYQCIGALSGNSLSFFDDYSANPASTGYRYKLKLKNMQGATSLFSNYHNTIYLTSSGGDFSWTPYQIENNATPIATYNIYRDDNSTGNFQSIGNTTGNQLGFTDINFASYPNAQYYVEAVMITGGCNPTRSNYNGSRSNVKHFGNSGVQQLNNVLLLSVYPNPSGNILNINGITGKTTLRLFDVIGKMVIENEVENDATINISNLSEGIYTLSTDCNKGKIFSKVVISR